METKEVKDFINNKDYQITTIEEVKTKLNELNIYTISTLEGETWKFADRIVKILYNDYQNPIVIKEDTILKIKKLYINPNWYNDNKETCDELFNYICEFTNRKKLNIETSEIINTNIIDSLCKNKSLEEVKLAQYTSPKYILSKSDYEKFKTSTIKKVDTADIEDSLKENFDPLIGYNDRSLISHYNYEDLQTREEMLLMKDINNEELENFKFLSSSISIKLFFDNYDNVFQVISKLEELQKDNKVIITIKNKEKFNKFLLKTSLSYENIYIKLGLHEYHLKEYLKFEKILYDCVKDINHLSPFEKYIYIYNITKKYKKYKENIKDKSESRDLYKILMNEYMVCVGFSHMLEDLLNKQNIENTDLSVSVDVSYDGEKLDEEIFSEAKVAKKGEHARRYVYLKDEKYGIDGFYIADPTWDNDLEHDLYNHLAMTNLEASKARRYIWTHKNDSEELLNITSIEEYYEKINFIITREKNKRTLTNIIKDLVDSYIAKLDSNYIEKLKEKYNYISSYSWPEDINDLIYEIGEYLVNHVNKEIPGNTIMTAVSNVYKNAYGYSEEDCQKKMKEIIKENKEKQEYSFPKRYKIKEDGTKEVIMNEKNKFDIEINENSIVR